MGRRQAALEIVLAVRLCRQPRADYDLHRCVLHRSRRASSGSSGSVRSLYRLDSRFGVAMREQYARVFLEPACSPADGRLGLQHDIDLTVPRVESDHAVLSSLLTRDGAM